MFVGQQSQNKVHHHHRVQTQIRKTVKKRLQVLWCKTDVCINKKKEDSKKIIEKQFIKQTLPVTRTPIFNAFFLLKKH